MTRNTSFEQSLQDVTTTLTSTRPTRRQLIKTLAAGSLLAVGGSALAACSSNSSNGSPTQVTLQAAGNWPISYMPDKDLRAKDPFYDAYAGWLSDWLKKNPGVTVKSSTANIWDQKALSTAIGAGTAPSWFLAGVLGSFDDAGTRAAFARGQAADTTELFKTYRSKMQISDYAQDAWQTNWLVNGHYYGALGDYFPGRGIYYRKDLLKEAGVKEPTSSWSWLDVRDMAKALTSGKRKGIVFQKTALGTILDSHQAQTFTMVPANTGSNWHWKYDYTTKANEWETIVNVYRGMVFNDKSVLQDVNYGEDQAKEAFFRGDVAMAEMHSSFYTHPAQSDASSPAALAKKLNKPLDEVVGYVIDPSGSNKAFGATQGSVGVVSMDPHLKKSALEKAFDLYVSFWLVDGAYKCNQVSYKAKPTVENALSIYQGVTPTNKSFVEIEGIPGNNRKYWGDKVVDALLEGAKIPIIPNYARFVPSERTAGPPPQAYTDAITKLAFGKDNVSEVLKTLEQTRNQQAASLPSNASQAEFNKGARAYYQALADFWRTNSPDFYNNELQPWYQQYAAPIVEK